MPALVFDIETVGEEFDALDETTQGVLTRWIKKESKDEEEYTVALADLKDGLGFSPLTGKIVAIGILDAERYKGAVYFDAAGSLSAPVEEGKFSLKPMSEKDMLEQFWKVAGSYDQFVSFNGRCFDVPFIMLRSAIHKVKPTKALMANRYLGSQPYQAKHIDLFDQLSFYGATRRPGNLHLYCRAFGIKSPKADGVTGDDVAGLFKEGRYLDIAKYNTGDLLATKALYEYWKGYLNM